MMLLCWGLPQKQTSLVAMLCELFLTTILKYYPNVKWMNSKYQSVILSVIALMITQTITRFVLTKPWNACLPIRFHWLMNSDLFVTAEHVTIIISNSNNVNTPAATICALGRLIIRESNKRGNPVFCDHNK